MNAGRGREAPLPARSAEAAEAGSARVNDDESTARRIDRSHRRIDGRDVVASNHAGR